jgi:hypothetical protein
MLGNFPTYSKIWSWPFVDTYRTFCLAPGPEAKELLLGVQQLTHLLVSRHNAATSLPDHLKANSGKRVLATLPSSPSTFLTSAAWVATFLAAMSAFSAVTP